jgi:hypothetical protein
MARQSNKASHRYVIGIISFLLVAGARFDRYSPVAIRFAGLR